MPLTRALPTSVAGRGPALAVALALAAACPAAAQDDPGFGAPRVFDGGFTIPLGVAGLPDEGVLVVESGAHRLRRADLAPPGSATSWATFGDVPDRGAPNALALPHGVAVDGAGNAYVADTYHDAVRLYRYDASSGSYALDPAFAPAPPASDPLPLSRPRDVAVGADGRVYALDTGNRRILVADGAGAVVWRVHRADPGWQDPFGLDVGDDGAVYLADTGNHRIVVLPTTGDPETLGGWGTDGNRLRRPRDVAVGPEGELFVADTLNHRVAVLTADGELLRSLGGMPLLGQPERIDLDPHGRILVTDSQNGWLVVWPGRARVAAEEAATPDADGYLRTARTDTGEEPFEELVTNESPAILVRARPDLDLTAAERDGLRLAGDDPLVFDRPSHLYFEIRNRGSEPLVGGAVGIWHRQVDGGDTTFPATWSRDDTYRRWRDAGDNLPGNFFEVSYVPAGGHAIAGPIVWVPPAPDGEVGCDHRVNLMARLVHLDDPTPELRYLESVRQSNNVVWRTLPLVPAACVPDLDRYESNDVWESRTTPDEGWEHLSARCPRFLIRGTGERYPDAVCPDVFETGRAPSPTRPAVSQAAEEIWNLVIPDLSLHGTTDRDFFSVPLPDTTDPRWGLHDIHPEEVRRIRLRHPGSYEPQPMPECGAVQRRAFGPPALDNAIWVNVSTELVVTAEPTDGTNNDLTDLTLDTAGERIRIYRDGEWDPELATGGFLVQRIVCPREVEGLEALDLSFGERFDSEGRFDPRPLEALGGYRLRLSYVSLAERGFPDWIRDFNDGRGVRPIPCIRGPLPFSGGAGLPGLPGGGGGFLPGGFFPFCGDSPFGPELLTPRHPQTPGLQPCLADGPGCLELVSFRWPRFADRMKLFFAAPTELRLRLLDAGGHEMSRSIPFQGGLQELPAELGDVAGQARLQVQSLDTSQLQEGLYFLEIQGKPTTYLLASGPRPAKAPDGP